MSTPRIVAVSFALAVTLTLSACGGGGDGASEAAETPVAEATATPTPEPSPELEQTPTPEPTTTPSPPAPEFTEVDVTEELRAVGSGAAWISQLVTATQTEPERVVVETTIADPRVDGASPEGQAATEVCTAAVLLLQSKGATDPKVSVMEADGSTYVVHGHPAYLGGCAEV